MDPSIFEPVNQEPSAIVNTLVSQLTKQYGKSYPWATGKGRQPPAGYILVKKTKAFQSGRPIISFVDSPFRPMPNILARMITDWSSGQKAICCCKHWLKFKTAALNPSDPHWVLAGSLLHSLLPADLSVIAEGSLLNKVFPSKKRTTLSSSVVCTVGQNVMASHQCQISTFPICATKCGLNTPRMSLYYQAIDSTFQDPSIFEPVSQDPATIVTSLVDLLQQQQHSRSYPWAVGPGRQLPAGYILAKRKKAFQSGRPIISFVDSPFRPMLNILARMIFQLIPVACPNHFASGDVYTLLEIPRSAPVDANLILINQDLAGFFTSIDQDRFIGAWFMLLDFLRPKMDVSDHEVFSIYLANPTTRVTSSRAAHSVD
jgi:hypothetical protein